MTAFPKPTRRERKPKPLERGGRLPQKREKPRREPPRDEAYKAFVRTLRCMHPDPADRCNGAVQASHTGEDKGGGMKASDYSCLPQCRKHHEDWEQRKGVFAGWSRWERQEWAAPLVASVQALWAPRPMVTWQPKSTDAVRRRAWFSTPADIEDPSGVQPFDGGGDPVGGAVVLRAADPLRAEAGSGGVRLDEAGTVHD